MDGLTAAEVIRSVRPQARVILHTASADESKRARARELGLTVLVKGDFDATIAAVTERLQEAKQGSPLRAGLEALVLSALAARSAEAVVVINAEQSISFYSAAAAKLLRLPLPAEPMTLAEMRLQHPLFDTESVTSPLAAAGRVRSPRRGLQRRSSSGSALRRPTFVLKGVSDEPATGEAGTAGGARAAAPPPRGGRSRLRRAAVPLLVVVIAGALVGGYFAARNNGPAGATRAPTSRMGHSSLLGPIRSLAGTSTSPPIAGNRS
jgi:hypothetical protein